MFSPDNYQLLDFGDGRRLERFGSIVLDRPCPAAEGVPRDDPPAWRQADASFQRTRGDEGRWIDTRPLPPQWTVTCGPLVLELRRTALGQVGLFPEQQANWDWIARHPVRSRTLHAPPRSHHAPPRTHHAPRDAGSAQDVCGGAVPHAEREEYDAVGSAPLRVLHLFAYTGAASLAAAAAGAEVTHVDASRPAVAAARRNAALSGLATARIRWIVEDAVKYAGRELRRGSRYDAVILDPPSYGHGAGGEPWVIEKDLPRLLELCGHLTAGRRRWVLLTCHTPQLDADCLRSMLADSLTDGAPGTFSAGPLVLSTAAGRRLPSGVVVRWEAVAQ
jgi:23S rRNA (cytosine1962-C5)-methyltransferase